MSDPAPSLPADAIAGVVLAGGRATRMGGMDKSLLPLAGRPMLSHVIGRIAPQLHRLALNANGDPDRFRDYRLAVLPDSIPGYPGPLAGILAGMDWAAAEGATAIVTVAGDTPFLPPDLVARLGAAAVSGGRPIAMAATPGAAGPQRHPTFALWPVSLREALRAAIASGTRRVAAWAEAEGCTLAEFPDPDAFFNVNTPADLLRAETLAAR